MITLMKSQLDYTIELLHDTIGKFDDEAWKAGFGRMHYPWRIAWHTIQCLEAYFSPGVECKPKEPFNAPLDETPDDRAPSVAATQEYLREVIARIEQRIKIDDRRDLAETYIPSNRTGRNILEQYVYAIRHTMHHHGALAALAVKAGVKDIMWK